MKHSFKKTFRTLVASAVIMAMATIGASASGGAQQRSSYPDVKPGDWFYTAVHHATYYEYMSGYDNGCFGPYDTMTRAQVAQSIYNACLGNPTAVNNVFKDVPDGKWFTDAVNWMYDMNLISGYGNGYFGVNDGITRQDLSVMMYKVLEGETWVDVNEPLNFADAGEISDYAVTAMKFMVQNGLMSGTPENTLDPKREVTRGEFAQVMMNVDVDPG